LKPCGKTNGKRQLSAVGDAWKARWTIPVRNPPRLEVEVPSWLIARRRTENKQNLIDISIPLPVKQLNASPQDNASYKGVEKTWNS
jgi:hypothetical protein